MHSILNTVLVFFHEQFFRKQLLQIHTNTHKIKQLSFKDSQGVKTF